MKYPKLLITAIILSLFVVVGCTTEETTTSTDGAFIGGTQGVVAQFEPFGVEEDGMYTIFDSETFPIEVTLTNKGESDIAVQDVTVRLIGPAAEEVEAIESRTLQNQGTLEGISELVPDGEEETVTFASDAKYVNVVNGAIDREWFGEIVYNYKTFLIIPEVCLKEDLTDDRICVVQEAKDFFVSGAPVTVKAVNQDTAGKGIMALKIGVSNDGTGKVAKLGEEFGVRSQFSYGIDDPAWECKSSGKVNEGRFIDGKAEIVCKLIEPLAEDSLGTKQVQLTLEYQYRDLISEKLRIKESS